MSKHTPGPWVISYTHDDNLSMAIDDEPGMQGERNYDLVTVTHGDPDELLANAQLIAAAPDLLNALQLLLKASEKEFKRTGFPISFLSGINGGAVEKARAAINKATGE